MPWTGAFIGGVCDIADYDLQPTGKTCGGECEKNEDCCELPTTINAIYGIRSCEDLVALYLNGDVDTYCPATPGVNYAAYCFWYRTYCECADETLSCDSNRCVYSASCENNGNTTRGCPTYTRTSQLTPTTICDVGGTDKCVAAGGGTCNTDAQCVGDLVADDATDTCNAGECTCYENSCYRKCDEDTDCPAGRVCDVNDTQLCLPTPACASDEDCKQGDVRLICDDGTCRQPCLADHDCSPSGPPFGAFNGTVCADSGFCEPLGCTSSDQCAASGGVRTFCVEPAPAAAAGPSSAVTD